MGCASASSPRRSSSKPPRDGPKAGSRRCSTRTPTPPTSTSPTRLAAGAGLCDVDAVRVLVDEGPSRVHELIALGAAFDRDPQGQLELAREGGHSVPRIVHAGGAATGAEIERTLVDAVRAEVSAVYESSFALDLIVEGGRCRGVIAADPSGGRREVRATARARGHRRVRPALRGDHQPDGGDRRRRRHGDPRGRGRGGRRVRAVPPDRAPPPGHAPAAAHRGAPRARRAAAATRTASGSSTSSCPRDKVSRAITARMIDEGVEHLWLDATGLDGFADRFPTIDAELRQGRARSCARLAADRARRALQLRWHPRRPRRGVVASGAVGGGRGELQRRDGCQPPGVELAAGRHGVRPSRGRGDRPGRRWSPRHRRDARLCSGEATSGVGRIALPPADEQRRPGPRRAAATDDRERRRPALG